TKGPGAGAAVHHHDMETVAVAIALGRLDDAPGVGVVIVVDVTGKHAAVLPGIALPELRFVPGKSAIQAHAGTDDETDGALGEGGIVGVQWLDRLVHAGAEPEFSA